jgi:hypothetical protein
MFSGAKMPGKHISVNNNQSNDDGEILLTNGLKNLALRQQERIYSAGD